MKKHLLLFLAIFLINFWLPSRVIADSQTSQKLELKKSFKGWELYSWRNKESGIWSFSLLHGTNRNKTEDEIKSPEVTKDINSIKEELNKIARDQSVSWFLYGAEGLEYPPDVVVDEIMAIGKKNGFQIAK